MAYDPKVVAARVKAVMEVNSCDQSDLASMVGVTQGAIGQILTGRTRQSKHLPQIAQALGVNLDWVLGIKDERVNKLDKHGHVRAEDDLLLKRAQSVARHKNHRLRIGNWESEGVRIKEIDLESGMGVSLVEGMPIIEIERVFPADWLAQFTPASSQHLFFARCAGDSMMPTIMDRDIMLIDTTQQTLNMADRIWVVMFGGAGMIKRLRPQPDGGVRLTSDNPSIRDEIAYNCELSIIGRVVGVLQKV